MLLVLSGWLVNGSEAGGSGAEIKVPALKMFPASYSTDLLHTPTEGKWLSDQLN